MPGDATAGADFLVTGARSLLLPASRFSHPALLSFAAVFDQQVVLAQQRPELVVAQAEEIGSAPLIESRT